MADTLTDKQRAFVAAYLGNGPGRLNATQAAIEAGYSRKTAAEQGYDNLRKPHIQAAIAEWRNEVKETAIAELSYRTHSRDELDARLWRVIHARAQKYGGNPEIPGGDTGLVVKRYKMVGGGESARLVEEYEVDTGLLTAMQANMKHAADDMGQSETRVKVSGSVRHDHRHRSLGNLSDAEIDSLEQLAEKIERGEVAV